jgi:hypothetical protein
MTVLGPLILEVYNIRPNPYEYPIFEVFIELFD